MNSEKKFHKEPKTKLRNHPARLFALFFPLFFHRAPRAIVFFQRIVPPNIFSLLLFFSFVLIVVASSWGKKIKEKFKLVSCKSLRFVNYFLFMNL